MKEGIAALLKEDFAKAFDLFRQARAEDPSRTAVATMWMAVARERQERVVDAEALYQEALAATDEKLPEAATILELHAGLLRRLGRTDEADALAKRAYALLRTPVDSLNIERRLSQKECVSRPAGGGGGAGGHIGSSGSGGHIGSGGGGSTLLSKVEPEYTDEARAARYQGTVALSVVIGPDGQACDLKILRGMGLGLNEKAIEAVTQWKFRPRIVNDEPVAFAATIELIFRLD